MVRVSVSVRVSGLSGLGFGVGVWVRAEARARAQARARARARAQGWVRGHMLVKASHGGDNVEASEEVLRLEQSRAGHSRHLVGKTYAQRGTPMVRM